MPSAARREKGEGEGVPSGVWECAEVCGAPTSAAAAPEGREWASAEALQA